MKLPLILPALALPALFAPALHAQDVTDLAGNVSAVNINLTVRETIGGLNEAQATRFENRGFDIPTNITYDGVFNPSAPASNIRNPYGWELTRGNNYVERSRNDTSGPTPVVTAYGSHKIHATRYTNATLLADLAAAGRIPTARGYRVVAVRFDLPNAPFDAVYNNGTYSTAINTGLYFFAEPVRGSGNPVFLGAENDVYDYEQVIDFESYETAEAGNYTDVFTGRTEAEGGGFAYDVLADSYSGMSLAEVSIYRPSAALSYYEMRVGGIFRWKETYNARQDVYVRAAITGKGLSGPANTYVAVDTDGDLVTDAYEPSGLYEGVVSGNIVMPAARQQTSLVQYMNQIPPVLQD